MARKGTFVWVAIAAVVAAVAVFWPQIEHQLAAQGVGCPWPFSHLAKTGDASSDAATQDRNDFSPLLPSYTVEELKKYDGTDEDQPILLAVSGKVLDVTSGAKFYAPGKTYHQFAGTACTRALALSSLKKEDINDDISDFTEKQKRSLEETQEFYFEKYPVVGVLV